jgi:hypothetical protein
VTNGGDVLSPAHGSADMPGLGPGLFRGLDPSDPGLGSRFELPTS